MYVATVPNRTSPPAILLRESYREAGKVKTRTIANISHLRPAQIEALRGALSGNVSPTGFPLPGSFRIDRSPPPGHAPPSLASLPHLPLSPNPDSAGLGNSAHWFGPAKRNSPPPWHGCWPARSRLRRNWPNASLRTEPWFCTT